MRFEVVVGGLFRHPGGLFVPLVVALTVAASLLLMAQVCDQPPLRFLASVSDHALGNWFHWSRSAVHVLAAWLLLVVFSAAGAWLQVLHPEGGWGRFGIRLLWPSLVPAYVYGLALDGAFGLQVVGGLRDLLFPLGAVLGNGVWWIWHQRWVGFLDHVRCQGAMAGVQVLGLDPRRHFLLPALGREILRRGPEMMLWVLASTLFVEAAQQHQGGVLLDLVKALGSGGHRILWFSAGEVLLFIALLWLLAWGLCRWGLRRPSGRGPLERLFGVSNRMRAWFKTAGPWLPLALTLVSTYALSPRHIWARTLLWLVVTGGLLQHLWSSRSVEASPGRPFPGRIWLLVVALWLLWPLQAGLQPIWDNSSVPVGTELLAYEPGYEGLPMEEDSLFSLAGLGQGTFALAVFALWILLALGVGGAVIYAFSRMAFSAFCGCRSPRALALYQGYRHSLEALAQIPPYLPVMAAAILWLGGSGAGGCTKQAYWLLVLLLALLPGQLVHFNGWIERADRHRFLVARRALGEGCGVTFHYLLWTRWRRGALGLAASTAALIVLMDLSVLWVTKRGFTCSGLHWLQSFETLSPMGAGLLWAGYLVVMTLLLGTSVAEFLGDPDAED